MLVSPQWQPTPSVYGPVATWIHLLGALDRRRQAVADDLGADDHDGLGFLATGYVLLRTAANPVRAVLLWVANPLLIVVLVSAATWTCSWRSRRSPRSWSPGADRTAWHDVLVGLLVGMACGIKVNAAYVALGIAIPIMHDRAWERLASTGAVAAAGRVRPVLLQLRTWRAQAAGQGVPDGHLARRCWRVSSTSAPAASSSASGMPRTW